jgi:hypothetical protein
MGNSQGLSDGKKLLIIFGIIALVIGFSMVLFHDSTPRYHSGQLLKSKSDSHITFKIARFDYPSKEYIGRMNNGNTDT